MASDNLKKQLHSYIDMIDDETQLQILHETAENYVTKPADILDLLTQDQLKQLEESLKQADENKLIPHEEVMKLSKQWLTK